MKPLTRRRWLMKALAVANWPRALPAMDHGEEAVPFRDCDDFQVELSAENPRVKCYDLRRLRGPLTPNPEFFVFHQTTAPAVALESWKLHVVGCIERPATLTLADLGRIAGPRQELEFTLECAGNLPRPEIMNGQVGNARWSGFRLAALLNHCGVTSEAREVIFFGADQVRDSAGVPFGPHARSVFIQDILNSDAILATHMNGEPLSPEHGFPLRLILPGWYGMTQIKWLSRIELIDRRFEGAHMSRNYHTLQAHPGDGRDPLVLEISISKTRLKSVIGRVSRRRHQGSWIYRVAGAAWGGAAPIDRVEVQVDEEPWRTAEINERRGRYAWLLWSCDVLRLSPGRHRLTSRAVDLHGTAQPTVEEWQRGTRSARENNSQWTRVIEIPS
jgi:DMSO/TMAO reductase YedYZ molybdopterin-dependent catalytic subunit